MCYKMQETLEAIEDVTKLASYMEERLKNPQAALRFLDLYDEHAQRLQNFPFGYRGISFEYQGYEIRMKPFETYCMFFSVDEAKKCIVILRVMKKRQDWMSSIKESDTYHI